MPARTQQEIVARLRHARADGEDVLAGQQEVLLAALDFDHARLFPHPSVRRNRWRRQPDHESRARAYLVLAICEIINHRDAQARRAVVALAELAWLLGHDDVVAAMVLAGDRCCGAPKVKAFAEGLGWRFAETVEDPESRHMLTRMAQGQQCHPDGCRRGPRRLTARDRAIPRSRHARPGLARLDHGAKARVHGHPPEPTNRARPNLTRSAMDSTAIAERVTDPDTPDTPDTDPAPSGEPAEQDTPEPDPTTTD